MHDQELLERLLKIKAQIERAHLQHSPSAEGYADLCELIEALEPGGV